MSNPAPLPIKQFALFAKLPLDAAVLLCRYLTIKEVEAMGSTCREARAQFLRLKQRPDFWRSLVPIEHPLQMDWSRPTPPISFRPPIMQGSNKVEMAMNEKGDTLFVSNHEAAPSLLASLMVYPRTSLSPLKFARGIRCQIDGMRMVGMDNDATHPGVYLWQQATHELWVWHAKRGLTHVGKFPECLQIVAHSLDNILYLNAIQNNQLIAQQFKITEQGLVEMATDRVQEEMTHSNFLLKLSPGGQSLMVIDLSKLGERLGTLVVRNSKNLTPRTGREIAIFDFRPKHLSGFSITDGGSSLLFAIPDSVTHNSLPQISALDRQDFISNIPGKKYYKIAHSGDGKVGIKTEYAPFGELRTYQFYTTPKILPASLEQAIIKLATTFGWLRRGDGAPLSPREFMDLAMDWLRDDVHREPLEIITLREQLRILQAQLKHATPARLSSVSEEFCNIKPYGSREDNNDLLFIYDLANCLDLEDAQSPIKPFQFYWFGYNGYVLTSTLKQYSQGKKPKHELLQRFIEHANVDYKPITFGHLLLDLCRQMPKGPTLADVLCQSRHATDRALHKLIPKRLAQAMLSAPALCNYVILAALMRKMITWTDDHKKKAHLQATHDAMVRAAEADPDLRFNADRLMNERHENCDTVFQCLQNTPYYKTMMKHFNAAEREHQEEYRPRQWGC